MISSVALVLAVLSVSLVCAENQRTCEYVYSDWGICTNDTQTRSMICVCDGKGDYDLTFCLEQNIVVAALKRPCDSSKLACNWRWTLWSECTAACDGGNVTREQVCMCDGMRVSAPDDYCDLSQRFGREVAVCNSFACDKTPARSKTYWMEQAEAGEWPMEDAVFNCSKGFDGNATNPKGKRYSRILLSKDLFGHPQWLYLAREWIAAKLNLASGVQFPPEILPLLGQAEALLEKCNGWTGKDYYLGVAIKQKLGRTNNNIGGLEHVDEQVARVIHYTFQQGGADTQSTLGLLIAIPAIAIVVIGVIIGLTIYYIREKNNSVVEQAVFDSHDEESTDEPLAKPAKGGDNLSPVAGIEEDKFDHSESSEHL